MRIAIDASSLMPPRTGIGNYSFQLVRELLRLDRRNSYTLFFNSLRRPLPDIFESESPENVRIIRRRIPGSWLHRAWRRWRRPLWETLAGPADIVHAPASIVPPVLSARRVVTLHDCYFMRSPENCHALGGLYMRETLPRLIHECDAVVCVSHFTRDEAVELLGLDPARAWVAHAGVDTTRFRVLDEGLCIDFARKRLVLPLQFFLTVATLEPRKNLQGLFEAYARLKAITPDPPKLVCVGEEGFQTDEIYARLDALQLRDDVFFTGFLENEDLPYLYNLAVAMVMPSLYEGFGLPVLEAMACGTPVLASRIPALQETGGDAALYIPPEDAAGWAEAMRRLADSSALQVQLREKGLARVGQFAWSDTARKTLAVYEKLAPATS